jgi:hypothetical protein
MRDAATDATKPDPSLCFGVPFHQSLRRGTLIGIDLEILGLDIDGDVLVIVFILDLGANDPLEYLLTAFGELRCFFGHGSGAGCVTVALVRSYAGGLVSFPRGSNRAEQPDLWRAVEERPRPDLSGKIDLFGQHVGNGFWEIADCRR